MFRSDAQRRAAFTHMGATPATRGSRVVRFLKRHPGVRVTARRALGVAAVTGGLALATRVGGLRALRGLDDVRALRTSGHMLGNVYTGRPASAGLRALKYAVARDVKGAIGVARQLQHRKVLYRRAALIAGSAGTLWATHPTFEARANVLERRHGRRAPLVVVHRRRGGHR